MKPKKIILLSILPVFFLCTQRQAVLGVNLQAKTNCILKAVQTNDDEEIIEAIKEATKTSNDITNSMIKIQGFNADSVYINWLSSEGSSLRSNNEKLLKYLDEFRYRNPKIISYFQEYSEKDYTLDNLSKILQSKSESEIPELTYIDDFVIDEGMHDFIKERNGGAFVYDFGYSEPKTILNPDYLKVYSVYDEVLNDKENTADDEASSLSLGNTAIISLTTLLYNIGLSKTAVETIKNALLALRSVIRYFVPFKVRVAIIVGIITVAAIAIIVNWAQISCVMDAILDAFLSVAGQFNDCIKETFSTVIDRAETSSGTENITIDGKTITMY